MCCRHVEQRKDESREVVLSFCSCQRSHLALVRAVEGRFGNWLNILIHFKSTDRLDAIKGQCNWR